MSVRYVSLYMVKGKNANAKGGEGFSFMILLMVDVTLLGCPTQFSNFQCHSGLSVTNWSTFMAFLPSKYMCILYWFQLKFHICFFATHIQCPRIIKLEIISSGIFFLATASCSSFVLLLDKYS